MKHGYILYFLMLLSTGLYSQSLILKQGQRQKIFKPDSFYEVFHSKSEFPGPDSCCSYVKLKGSIKKIFRDSIEINIKEISSGLKIDEVKFDNVFISYSGLSTIMIAKSDINTIKNYKSLKNYKIREKFIAPGGILVFAAGLTLINTFVVQGKNNKNNLLKLSAAEFAVGLTFLIIHTPKKYKLKEISDPWIIAN